MSANTSNSGSPWIRSSITIDLLPRPVDHHQPSVLDVTDEAEPGLLERPPRRHVVGIRRRARLRPPRMQAEHHAVDKATDHCRADSAISVGGLGDEVVDAG